MTQTNDRYSDRHFRVAFVRDKFTGKGIKFITDAQVMFLSSFICGRAAGTICALASLYN